MSSSGPVKNVLILGATGPLGLAITREALLQNLHPTLFVRNPSKLPEDISGHPDVTVCSPAFLKCLTIII
jgi:putative NADH-flavin reductase